MTSLYGANTVNRRVLISILACAAAFSPAFGADFGVPGGEFHLKGVLISPGSRSALINNSIAKVGDTVSGAEIVAIEQGNVRIRSRSSDIIVEVGGNLDTGRIVPRLAAAPRAPNLRSHTVKSGETLSEIAERYLVEGATLNQTMMALFEANPHAFDGNINRLEAGVTLELPGKTAFFGRSPETALAAVLEHVENWKSGAGSGVSGAIPAVPEPVPAEYGPVASGETLSGIAYELLPEGESLNSMMSAIFDANPDAFGDDMDFLREGAVLHIPEAYAQRLREPRIDPVAAVIY